MKVDTAFLADAATVREGLLHVLGGGISWVNRPQFPAPLGIVLVLRVSMHQTEVKGTHSLDLMLLGEDGAEVMRANASFSPTGGPLDPEIDPTDELFTPIVLPLLGVPVPKPGRYSFEILIDGAHSKTIALTARVAQS